jgi:hypothetical protein
MPYAGLHKRAGQGKMEQPDRHYGQSLTRKRQWTTHKTSPPNWT